jgi:hypothetical protein
MELKVIVSVQSHQINCITKSAALTILFDLCAERLRSSLQLLRILRFERLAEHLLELYPEMEPDKCNLETICDAVDVKIYRFQIFELTRQYYCDRERIANFLIKYEPLFARDHRVI